jgi:WD40 repeat protein
MVPVPAASGTPISTPVKGAAAAGSGDTPGSGALAARFGVGGLAGRRFFPSSPAGLAASAAVGGAAAAASSAPGGAYVATGGRDRSVRVWEVSSGRCVAAFEEHDSWVRGVAFHPNGVWVVSAGEDKCVRVWDIPSGRLVKRLDDAGEHFLTCLALRAGGGGGGGGGGGSSSAGGGGAGGAVLVTAGVDQALRVWDCR